MPDTNRVLMIHPCEKIRQPSNIRVNSLFLWFRALALSLRAFRYDCNTGPGCDSCANVWPEPCTDCPACKPDGTDCKQQTTCAAARPFIDMNSSCPGNAGGPACPKMLLYDIGFTGMVTSEAQALVTLAGVLGKTAKAAAPQGTAGFLALTQCLSSPKRRSRRSSDHAQVQGLQAPLGSASTLGPVKQRRHLH